ncbi:hypothetical protein IHE55_19655 [Streptomyces pactum]|uniref:Integral membrane protein n=1 Tax=Streptomyces pactum TaxID=68249 RepID=A0ABS0NNW6_9ACTN|nr:hypothetical protein [Streptomyces pactum]MBH5336863.1 hypothetical protein [Streptomyces pactum]
MIWEALGSAVLGLVVAFLTARWLPRRRLPALPLVLGTGAVAGLLGTFLAHAVLGSGHAPVTLLVAAGFTVAMLSLLVRPDRRLRRSAAA